jgi:hypothetical protein
MDQQKKYSALFEVIIDNEIKSRLCDCPDNNKNPQIGVPVVALFYSLKNDPAVPCAAEF